MALRTSRPQVRVLEGVPYKGMHMNRVFTITVTETVDVFGSDEVVTNIVPHVETDTPDFDDACKRAAEQVFAKYPNRNIHAVHLGLYRDNLYYYEGWKGVSRTFEKDRGNQNGRQNSRDCMC